METAPYTQADVEFKRLVIAIRKAATACDATEPGTAEREDAEAFVERLMKIANDGGFGYELVRAAFGPKRMR